MNNARKPDETKEQYHARLKEEQKAFKEKLKGRVFWNSDEKGTYVKKPVGKATPHPGEQPVPTEPPPVDEILNKVP